MIPVRGYAGHRVAVLGLGRSGLPTVAALRAGGAEVVAWDDDEPARARAEADGRTIAHAGGVTQAGYADTSFGMKWHAADQAGRAPSLGVLLHADVSSGSTALRGAKVRPSLRLAAEWELAEANTEPSWTIPWVTPTGWECFVTPYDATSKAAGSCYGPDGTAYFTLYLP